eukprot:3818744-Prymnesium_polylepis.3
MIITDHSSRNHSTCACSWRRNSSRWRAICTCEEAGSRASGARSGRKAKGDGARATGRGRRARAKGKGEGESKSERDG